MFLVDFLDHDDTVTAEGYYGKRERLGGHKPQNACVAASRH
jgi:hypothetical protein